MFYSQIMRGRLQIWFSSATAWWLAMATVTLVAAVIRLNHLGAESLWYDEASTWEAMKVPARRFVTVLARRAVSPPLYFALMKGWTSVAGNSEVALRLLAVPAVTLTVLALGWLSRHIAGPGPALVGSLLLALSPFHL